MPEQPNKPDEVRTRSLSFEVSERDEGQGFELSFSSEEPCQIWGETEILSHAPGAMRMGERQKSLCLLFNHDRNDLVGSVTDVHVDDETRKGRCTVRFAETARGQEIKTLVESGMLRNVSVSYRVFKYDYDKERDIWTAVDWEPLEISLVTVPADPTVGVGRSLNPPVDSGKTFGEVKMPENNVGTQNNLGTQQAVEQERSRVNGIMSLCRQHNIDEKMMQKFLTQGTSLDEARGAVLEIIRTRQSQMPTVQQVDDFLSERDLGRYSLSRAILGSLTGNWRGAEFERDVSEHLYNIAGRESTGVMIPLRALVREYKTTATANGGAIVDTDLRDDLMVMPLRNRCVVGRLGARFITGLKGNVAIPKMDKGSTIYWVEEGSAGTESEGTFGQIAMKPHTAIALSRISRNLLMQSNPSIDSLLREDFLQAMAEAVDTAALVGTGEDAQPEGLLYNDEVNVIVGGTNGAELTYDHIIDMETEVSAANANGATMAYVANARTIGKMKKLKVEDGTRVWYTALGGVSGTPGQINGYTCEMTNILPGNLTKGTASKTCQAMAFGDFSKMVIGQWGAIEVLANPYESTAFKSGGVLMRIINAVDVAIRQPKAFSVMKDILLTAPAGSQSVGS